MSESGSKLFSMGKILGGLVFCLIISFLIYFISMFVAFGAWHCSGKCAETPVLLDILIFAMWLSPFLIFAAGAYLCRGAIYALIENKFFRIVALLLFAFFPLYIIAGFVIYAINSK